MSGDEFAREKMYERGVLTAHTSDEDSGIPDVGLSVGLGDGAMLYVGDIPNPGGCGLKIYTQERSIEVADHIDFDAGKEAVEMIAYALNRSVEDQEDIKAARDALAEFHEKGGKPMAQVKQELGL